jgi:hypothetical protein
MNFVDVVDLNNLIRDNRYTDIDLPENVSEFITNITEARKNSKTLMPLGKNYQYTGAAGEHVICRLFNEEMNTDIYDGKGDGGTDLVWRGQTIQVKATTIPTDGRGYSPYLIFFMGERLRCDIYILVGVYDNKACIYGWITREELNNKWRVDRSGKYKPDKYNNSRERRVLYMNQLNCNEYDTRGKR